MKKKAWEKPVCEKVRLRQAEANKGGHGYGHCKISHHHGGPHHRHAMCHSFAHCKAIISLS
jgi:hypothetical protein